MDFDGRITSLGAGLKRAEAAALTVKAQVQEALARKTYADAQAKRYEQLIQARLVSEEMAGARQQERDTADASVAAAHASLNAANQATAGLSVHVVLRSQDGRALSHEKIYAA